ncbi:MAG: monovalent cation/H+ antiporter subunit D family protein [Pseudomonadota bacterium]
MFLTIIQTNIIAWQVILPLISAPICAMVQRHNLAWIVTFIVTLLSFATSIYINIIIFNSPEPISYFMGGWVQPIGIELRLTHLNSIILLLLTGSACILMPFANKIVRHEIDKDKHALFYAVFLLCLAGLIGITLSNDLFNIYVFLEISSLATYSLIALGKDKRSLTAAFEYLIIGSIGATLYLIGLGFLYIVTGTLNFTDLSLLIPHSDYTIAIIAGCAFMTVGVLMKIALFPLHIWLCRAYTYAPSFISTFLSATATKVSIYLLIRIIYELFGFEFQFSNNYSLTNIIQLILNPLALLAILVGSYQAMKQNNIKMSLAYSSIAQIGYIILTMSLITELGLIASITHIFNHALAKAGLFAVCGVILMKFGGVNLANFKGAGKLMPITMGTFVIFGLSLIGIPLTAGFVSKWLLIKALIASGAWISIIVVILASIAAIIYIWRIIEVAYFDDHPNAINFNKKEAPWYVLISLGILAILNIYFGVMPGYPIAIAEQVSAILINGENL